MTGGFEGAVEGALIGGVTGGLGAMKGVGMFAGAIINGVSEIMRQKYHCPEAKINDDVVVASFISGFFGGGASHILSNFKIPTPPKVTAAISGTIAGAV